ncbi:MAG TPA: SCP2 sterol-binding domain-containing protein [Acidimicrobiales bacterium]|nr:SCP2 sterol-binding domain-containing protein [Acidimicrobiales bacterium]
MARYLSPEWIDAFDQALSGLDLSAAIAGAGTGSLTAADGAFAVAQEVGDGPEGPVRTVLTVAGGRVTLQSDPGGKLPSNVTIVVDYADARAMADGELDPADALATGRVRVRGELAVLVAGQTVLAAAATQLGGSLAELTD